jgi:hypothetical protein
MQGTQNSTDIPDDVAARLQAALENAAGGIRDAEAARQARERINRIREENRRLFGEQNVAVELIRRTRDGT